VKAASNEDETAGGGARDLRFNPWSKFEEVVSKVFADVRELPDGRKVYTAPMYWQGRGDKKGPETVEFWSPTKSRGGEGRLSKIHLLTAFNEARLPAPEEDPFFLIWQDLDGTVWGGYVTVPQLRHPRFGRRVSEPVLEAVEMASAADNIRGWLDVRTGLGEHFRG